MPLLTKGASIIKYFKKYKMDHGGALNDGPTIANMPIVDKVKASKKMHERGVERVFAPFTRPEDQALEQLIREQK